MKKLESAVHTAVKLMTNKVVEKSYLCPVGTLYNLYLAGKIYSDEDSSQRIYQGWPEERANSYLTTLFNGMPLKDAFLLANILKIIEHIKSDIEKNDDTLLDDYLKFNLKYFINLKDKGYEYLIIDGQHRLQTIKKYFENKFLFNPKEEISYQVNGESGIHIIKGKFGSIRQEVANALKDVEVRVVEYSTGDLQELVNCFKTSNSGIPVTPHEVRILHYNMNNLMIRNLIKTDRNIKDMYSVMKGNSGKFHVCAKGDTLMACELLLWLDNNEYSYGGAKHENKLDEVFGPVKPNGKSKLYISETDRGRFKKIYKEMADLCKLYFIKYPNFKNKFGRASFYNLFYTLSFFMQETNVFGLEKDIAGKYALRNDDDMKLIFARWFFDTETIRLNAKGWKMHYGNLGAWELNPISFRAHNKDTEHKKKKSEENVAGSKYSFNDYARLRYLLADLIEELPKFQRDGILQEKGSRTGVSKEELAVLKGRKLSDVHDMHLDEKLPVSKGGSRTEDNTDFMDPKENINMSNRIK